MDNSIKKQILYKYLNEAAKKMGNEFKEEDLNDPIFISIFAAMEEYYMQSKERISTLEKALKLCRSGVEYFANHNWRSEACSPHASYIRNVVIANALAPGIESPYKKDTGYFKWVKNKIL